MKVELNVPSVASHEEISFFIEATSFAIVTNEPEHKNADITVGSTASSYCPPWKSHCLAEGGCCSNLLARVPELSGSDLGRTNCEKQGIISIWNGKIKIAWTVNKV